MIRRVEESRIVDELVRRGLTDAAEARRALRATLAVLGERLLDDEARALAEELPAELAAVVTDVDYDGDFDSSELYERVRRRERAGASRGLEVAEIVLGALGAVLEPDRRRKIARGLPEGAREVFSGRIAHGEPPPHAVPSHAPKMTTLATGRPGSAHPVSESAPPSGHTHSVACSPVPHEETKLSTTRGPTQERFRETLAEGKPPGPARPVAETKD